MLAVATCLLLVGVQAWTVAERNRTERAGAETGAAVVLQVRGGDPYALLDAVANADPGGSFAMAAVQIDSSSQEPSMLAVDSPAPTGSCSGARRARQPSGGVARSVHPDAAAEPRRAAGSDLGRRRPARRPVALPADALRAAGRRRGLPVPRRSASCDPARTPTGATCRRSACAAAAWPRLAVNHPGTDIGSATARDAVRGHHRHGHATGRPSSCHRLREPRGLATRRPDDRRPGGAAGAGPELEAGVRAPGGPYALMVRGDSPEPLPAVVDQRCRRAGCGGRAACRSARRPA